MNALLRAAEGLCFGIGFVLAVAFMRVACHISLLGG